MKTFLRVVSSAIMLFAGLALFVDSWTFALRADDPINGRIRGCYCWLDDLLRLRAPAEWTRDVQLALAGTLGISAIVVLVRALQSRKSIRPAF